MLLSRTIPDLEANFQDLSFCNTRTSMYSSEKSSKLAMIDNRFLKRPVRVRSMVFKLPQEDLKNTIQLQPRLKKRLKYSKVKFEKNHAQIEEPDLLAVGTEFKPSLKLKPINQRTLSATKLRAGSLQIYSKVVIKLPALNMTHSYDLRNSKSSTKRSDLTGW